MANYTVSVKLTSVDGTSRIRRFFAGLARSSMARQLRELRSATELHDNSSLRALHRAADRRKSSTSRRRTRLGCQSGLSLSHQRMSSVVTFTARTTYWRSGPIIIYIYQLDSTINLVSGEPWYVCVQQTAHVYAGRQKKRFTS